MSKKARVRRKLARKTAKLTTVEAQRVLLEQGQVAQRNFLQNAASKLIEDNKRAKPAGKNPGYMLGKRRSLDGAPPPRCETCTGGRELKLWCRIGSKRAGTLRTLPFCNEFCRDAWQAANPDFPIWHQRKTGTLKSAKSNKQRRPQAKTR